MCISKILSLRSLIQQHVAPRYGGVPCSCRQRRSQNARHKILPPVAFFGFATLGHSWLATNIQKVPRSPASSCFKENEWARSSKGAKPCNAASHWLSHSRGSLPFPPA